MMKKMKKGAEKTEDVVEKGLKKGWEGAKHLGKDIKDSKPGEAVEEGAKKGWGAVKHLGKDVKESLTKKEDEEK